MAKTTDEAVHGLYTGLVAQNIYNKLPEHTQEALEGWMYSTLNKLYKLECTLIEEVYDPVGLTEDVKAFIRYNANKALFNLGFDAYFEYEEVNPLVIRGLDTTSKTHDFFSVKGNSYQIMENEPLSDEDFIFDF